MSSLRDEMEAAFTRVYFADRKDRIAKEMAEAAIAVLAKATPKQIRELVNG